MTSLRYLSAKKAITLTLLSHLTSVLCEKHFNIEFIHFSQTYCPQSKQWTFHFTLTVATSFISLGMIYWRDRTPLIIKEIKLYLHESFQCNGKRENVCLLALKLCLYQGTGMFKLLHLKGLDTADLSLTTSTHKPCGWCRTMSTASLPSLLRPGCVRARSDDWNWPNHTNGKHGFNLLLCVSLNGLFVLMTCASSLLMHNWVVLHIVPAQD